MSLLKIAAAFTAILAVPAHSALLSFDLTDFTSAATRTVTIHYADGTTQTPIVETVTSASSNHGFFGTSSPRYEIQIIDDFLPFDLAGATLTYRDFGPIEGSLVSAAGTAITWVNDGITKNPSWLSDITMANPIQSSTFTFDSNRQITDFSIKLDFDGYIDYFTPASSRYLIRSNGFSPNGQTIQADGTTYNGVDTYIEKIDAGTDIRFVRTMSVVPLPAGLPMLATAFGLLLALRRKTRA